ncbi:MAG TPA: ferritin-like domain-containing protein, partial [Archangium sp.]
MSQRKPELLPKNRVLRRTLYRLVLAAPALPLMGCDPHAAYGDCGSWQQYTHTSAEVLLRDDEPLPNKPSCTPCPTDAGKKTERLLSCQAEETPLTDGGTQRSYHLVCTYEWCNPQDGRRPEGLQEPGPLEADSVLGAFNAHVAWLEAASVPAFLRLAEELSAHGAPEALVKAARRSAGDEVRHTRVMQALARRHGARMPEVDVAPFAPRSLEAMLTENAVEGCVRETYGALCVGWQARTAGDPELRGALRSIARDELRHSELAWAVDAWACDRLSSAERER